MQPITPGRLADQLGNADVTRVATAAFAIINAIQEHEGLMAGERIGAIAAAFILAIEASRMSAPDAIGSTRNLMADAQGRRPEFKAITDYLKTEVLTQ